MTFNPKEPKTWEGANPALQDERPGALCQACCYALGGQERGGFVMLTTYSVRGVHCPRCGRYAATALIAWGRIGADGRLVPPVEVTP